MKTKKTIKPKTDRQKRLRKAKLKRNEKRLATKAAKRLAKEITEGIE